MSMELVDMYGYNVVTTRMVVYYADIMRGGTTLPVTILIIWSSCGPCHSQKFMNIAVDKRCVLWYITING